MLRRFGREEIARSAVLQLDPRRIRQPARMQDTLPMRFDIDACLAERIKPR